jgi:hypothetical protein
MMTMTRFTTRTPNLAARWLVNAGHLLADVRVS